jgi:transcriptional regulator GlxA family with amidase domain
MQRRSLAVEGKLDLRRIERGDVIVVPGVLATKDASIERILARPEVQRVVSVLSKAARKGAIIAASCSATFLLGAAGLLDGGRATTTWWLMSSFAQRYPNVDLRADRMVVDSDGVLTAGSAFAHADLMLALVSRVAGPALARLTASYLVLDSRPSQSRYMVIDHLHSYDPLLRALEEHVTAPLVRQVSLDELAGAIGTSPRTLARKVHAAVRLTPHRFVQRIRVAHAAHLLETTHASIDEIAARVGYADAAAFRRVFRAHTGGTPRSRRAR